MNLMNSMYRLQTKLLRLAATALVGCLAIIAVGAARADSTTPSTRKSPDWLRSAVVYEIFPRNFSKAGDFNAITARLDELKDLGVNVLWLMPIHPTGEKMKKGSIGSPFAVRDFYAINPDYGTTNDFKSLIAEAHQAQLESGHGHRGRPYLLGQRADGNHPDFYLKDTNGVIIPPEPGWTDVAGLDYSNPEVRHYMIDMMKYWLQEFGVDGFRCDVAPNVPVDFWEAARTELEKINPQVIILADAGAKPATARQGL